MSAEIWVFAEQRRGELASVALELLTEGRVLAEKDPSEITREQLEHQISKWRGDIQQIPPMVSALKKNGMPLYKLARKDQEIEREPRLRHVYFFKLLEFDSPFARFRLKCTKGTYVRTLCADIGESLGCGAHLRELRRTRSGNFNIADSRPLNELLKMDIAGLERAALPITIAK